MDEVVFERRCKSCGKKLLDEKLPFCKRCVLKGRNLVGDSVGLLVGIAMAGISAKKLAENTSASTEQLGPDEEDDSLDNKDISL